MIDLLRPTFDWIKSDFHSNPLRFCFEILAWVLSIACSIIMAVTVPEPPLLLLYPLWISACAVYTWAAWTRKSFGMLANYVLLTSIDMIGLLRLILQ